MRLQRPLDFVTSSRPQWGQTALPLYFTPASVMELYCLTGKCAFYSQQDEARVSAGLGSEGLGV